MVKLALLVRLEAKPGKEKELEDLLTNALPMAQKSRQNEDMVSPGHYKSKTTV